MGIPKLHDQIGSGERIALSKLAVEHYTAYSRKYRIAIDASIWLFQIKNGRGGLNPEIRTLFYRLLKLLGLGIDPVFVFDGPGRPAEKRGKKVNGSWESPTAKQARALLDVFGFVHHVAPGEAEAECALLQTEGVVDAVMSEDVDTLMFGATLTLRNWSSQDARGKTRTHVSLFRSDAIKERTRLDREGMILVALMSGGDYDTKGISRCGPLIAYEAAKAGFGHDLCVLNPQDSRGLEEWQQRLEYELHTNESGYFKTKHPSIRIGNDFPSREVLSSYMYPSVSPQATLDDLKAQMRSTRNPEIQAIRSFVAETFGWDTLAGAKRLIRGLAPVLLTHRLLDRKPALGGPDGLLSVCGARTHHTSDGIPESRVEIIPLTLVPLDLEREPLRRPGVDGGVDAENSDSDVSDVDNSVPSSQERDRRERSVSPAKRRAPSKYNPIESEKFYIPEFYARYGASAKIEAWELSLQAPKQTSPKKNRTKNAFAKTGMREGAIESFFSITKSNSSQAGALARPPPIKKSRPPGPIRSKTDTEWTDSNTSLWSKTKDWKSNTPTWAEQQYYDHVESQRQVGKVPVSKNELRQASKARDATQRFESACTGTSPRGVGESDAFSSPISSQDLLQLRQDPPLPANFSSPVSSQALLDATSHTIPSNQVGKRQLANIRIRESLEGAWAANSSENQRAGTRLRGVDTVDMTRACSSTE